MKPAPENYIVYDFVRLTALPGFIWFRPKFIYANDSSKQRIKSGAIAIANHIGYFDPVYLMIAIWYRRHHFVCIREFFEGRFRAWLFRQFHCIPIDRDSFSMESLRRITEELKAGHLVSLYPEGRIIASKQVSAFKSGMVLMALRSDTPIIPVYIKPRKHWYSRLVICIGEQVNVSGELGPRPSLERINQLTAFLEEKELSLMKLAEERC